MTGTSMRTATPNTEPAAPLAMDPTMSGGRRRHSKSSRKSRRVRSSRKRGAKKGGMGAGFGAVIQEAIVPFGLFAWQKRSQKNRTPRTKSRRYRSYRRR